MHKIGDVIMVKVDFIQMKVFFGWTQDNYRAVVFINEISDFFVSDITHYVKVGMNIFLRIKKIEENERRLVCSFKELNPALLKDPFNYEIKETKNGFDNLLKNVNEKVAEWKKSN